MTTTAQAIITRDYSHSGLKLFQITAHAAGNPDYTVELRADDEWKARTRIMVTYPHPLAGKDVTYTVVELGPCRFSTGHVVETHNFASDGICTDCGANDGRFFASSNKTCREVARLINLEKPTYRAVSEDFQGTLTVNLQDGTHFLFGTANFTWGGDFYGKDSDESYESIDTGVSDQVQNLAQVARGIVRSINRFFAAKAFSEALSEFKCAAFALSEAWEKLDKDDHAAEALCNHYPFKESFDETVYAIQEWQEEVDNAPNFGNGKRPKK